MKARLALVGVLGMAACVLFSLSVLAAEKERQSKGPAGQKDQSVVRPYLGIAVEPLPPVLARQLPQLKGRGIVIAHVVKDSPAEKAGLKAHDILVSYDDQQIYSPEQLVRLVQNDKPKREASLEVFSAGKQEKVKVTLGEHHATAAQAGQPMHRFFGQHHFPTKWQEENESAWERFDSMTLTRKDDKHFKAQISYRDDKGKTESKTFEGSREDIRKAIEKEKDLPAFEREQLLHALSLHPRFLEFGMPPFAFGPWAGRLWDSDDLDHHHPNDSRDR